MNENGMDYKSPPPPPFADALEAMRSFLAVVLPLLELHRHGAMGLHDQLFEDLYRFSWQLEASESRSPVVNVCHTVGADAITGGYLTFTYADGRSIEHPLDLHGAVAILRKKIHEPHGRFGEDQKALLADLEGRLAGLSGVDRAD